MFIVIVQFPPLRPGKDQEFMEWFEWSNKGFAGHRGFIRRRLLKDTDTGSYAAIVEHESRDTFMAMNAGAFHAEAGKRVTSLFDGSPLPRFYEVVGE